MPTNVQQPAGSVSSAMDNLPGASAYRKNIESWTATTVKNFISPEVAEAYGKRTRRIADAIALKEVDEVPVYLLAEGYIETYSKILSREIFYDAETFAGALLKLHADFTPDYAIDSFTHCGPALDTLGMNLIRWPGSRWNNSPLPGDAAFQYVENEYMKAEEYAELINNPEGYLFKKYLPRICSNVSGLSDFPNVFKLIEASWMANSLNSLAKGTSVRRALDTLLKAADQFSGAVHIYRKAYEQIRCNYGAPELFGGISKAPFDIIGDTMRCTVGIVKDMYSRPQQVIAAAEALVPTAVQIGVETVRPGSSPLVIMPLHKGSDDFMSPEQFKAFYWPTLRATMQGIIDKGCVPVPFVEGSFSKRLETIAATPLTPGRSLWIFDRTDMAEAKKYLGEWACIAGNVPASLFKQGTPDMLEDYCKKLIESCGPGGGFCLFPGTVIDRANPENIRAFLQCGRKYGRF